MLAVTLQDFSLRPLINQNYIIVRGRFLPCDTIVVLIHHEGSSYIHCYNKSNKLLHKSTFPNETISEIQILGYSSVIFHTKRTVYLLDSLTNKKKSYQIEAESKISCLGVFKDGKSYYLLASDQFKYNNQLQFYSGFNELHWTQQLKDAKDYMNCEPEFSQLIYYNTGENNIAFKVFNMSQKQQIQYRYNWEKISSIQVKDVKHLRDQRFMVWISENKVHKLFIYNKIYGSGSKLVEIRVGVEQFHMIVADSCNVYLFGIQKSTNLLEDGQNPLLIIDKSTNKLIKKLSWSESYQFHYQLCNYWSGTLNEVKYSCGEIMITSISLLEPKLMYFKMLRGLGISNKEQVVLIIGVMDER